MMRDFRKAQAAQTPPVGYLPLAAATLPDCLSPFGIGA
jgi:hypothetical protein